MKVTAFLTDGFETVEALAVIDICRRAGIDTDTVSITGDKNVISAQNIPVKADMENEKLLNALKEHDKKGKRIAAICAAPSILGRIGLLKGKKATCFPGFEKYLDGAQVLLAPVRVVTDGNITTSRGMGTSVDLGLEIVKLLISEEKAKELAASTQYAD